MARPPIAPILSRRAVVALSAAPFLPRPALASPATRLVMHEDDGAPRPARPYAHPAAPKGGRLTLGFNGSFDTLNPFVVRGLAPPGARQYVHESLMARAMDEPFTLLPQVARAVETPRDRSFVAFHLDPSARFSDGRPIEAEDVAFTLRLLRERGRPNHRAYYGKVETIDVADRLTVRFGFPAADDRELPLILGLMAVLARHHVDPARFEETTLTPLLGSGPYTVGEVRPGDSVSFVRDPAWWGRDLPVNRGLFNFDEVRFDFYRDANALFEAFKRGLVDVRPESDPGQWASGYDFPALRAGRVRRDVVRQETPKGIRAYAMNLRRPLFRDARTREALGLLFDFEAVNRTLYAGGFARTGSIFEDSELAATGRPASDGERRLLERVGARVRPDVLAGRHRPPVSDGTGADRATLRRALTLFREAGFNLADGVLKSRATGEPFAFEIMVATREQERLALTTQRFFRRAGVEARLRTVDAVQYDRRTRDYDFDMIDYRWWNVSLSPGNEQAFYWGSEAGRQPGSRNVCGIADPAVDALVRTIVSTETRAGLIEAARALDRTLVSGFYWIPLFHQPAQWIARWRRIGMPRESSLFGYLPETWWREPEEEGATRP